MANTFVRIATSTVGSGGISTIDFTSIPQTYTDLKLVICARGLSGGGNVSIRFNSSTSGYTNRRLYGNGTGFGIDAASGIASASGSAVLACAFSDNTTTTNAFGTQEIYIPNYTSTNYKSIGCEGCMETNAATAYHEIISGLWANTAAITSISCLTYQTGGSFAQYTTATLYGIKST
jgi:hypothetical protein